MLVGGYSTEARKETVASDTYSGIGRKKLLIIRKIAWVIGKLLPFMQRYTMTTRVTFGLTNGSGVVGHDRLVNMFGTAREMFGLSRIPDFKDEIGRDYLLKTCAASFRHFGSFKFGDVIKIVVEIVEVNHAKFKLRGRFICGDLVYAIAYQTIAYTDMKGKPTGFPLWLKVLLELSCSREADNNGLEGGKEIIVDNLVFRRQFEVTSNMTNAERNVSHDEYARMMTQAIELMLNKNKGGQACLLKVEEGWYKYSHDFFFGDLITVSLNLVEADENSAVFFAEFSDWDGKIRSLGRQKVGFIDHDGAAVSTPLAIRAMLSQGV